MANNILRYFEYAHLQNDNLRNVSMKFGQLAHWIDAELCDVPEKSVALRKLLEAKDAAVRSALEQGK